MKIVDSFIFYNEIDLLLYRLNILYDVIDYFIIVESKYTFAGNEKEFFFEKNKNLFEKFMNKIIYVVCTMPYKYPEINYEEGQQWENEKHQRNCIDIGIKQIKLENDDLIIITDVDEIPNPSVINDIKNRNMILDLSKDYRLEMDFYYYNLNTKNKNKWTKGVIVTYKKFLLKNCQEIRLPTKKNTRLQISSDHKMIKNGGWHLSFFGDNSFIKNKIKEFSHQEFNNDININEKNIEEHINNYDDIFNRNNNEFYKININNNHNLPPFYDLFLQKFIKYDV